MRWLIVSFAAVASLVGCHAPDAGEQSVTRMCEALKSQGTADENMLFKDILCPGSKGLLADIISQDDRVVFAGIYSANADKPFPDFIRALQRNTLYKSKIQCFQALMIYGKDNEELLAQCKAIKG